MRILKKLENPFVLAANGFVLGAALVWTTGLMRDEPVQAVPASASAYQIPQA